MFIDLRSYEKKYHTCIYYVSAVLVWHKRKRGERTELSRSDAIRGVAASVISYTFAIDINVYAFNCNMGKPPKW